MLRLKIIVLVGLGFCSAFQVNAQLVKLHPTLKDTLYEHHMNDYPVFSNYINQPIAYAVVDSGVQIQLKVMYSEQNKEQVYVIEREELQEARTHIQKIYQVTHFPDSVNAKQPSILVKKDSTASLKGKLIDEEQQKLINQQVRQDARLNRDARQQELFKQGLETSPGGSIELFNGRKLKKKKD